MLRNKTSCCANLILDQSAHGLALLLWPNHPLCPGATQTLSLFSEDYLIFWSPTLKCTVCGVRSQLSSCFTPSSASLRRSEPPLDCRSAKARDLPLPLPQWPLMVYFVSKSILVLLCSNCQDKFSCTVSQASHELTCLQCRSAVVCHTFQIKSSQDGQCLRLAALPTGMVLRG